MKKIKYLSILIVCLTITAAGIFYGTKNQKSDDIIILYTNDVHTYIDKNISYDHIASIKQQLQEEYEYVFLVDVSEDQEAIVGTDPEVPAGKEQSIKNVCWKKLSELSEKDRAFLWSYGLLEVDGYFELVLSWGDEISYPEKILMETAD